MRKKQSIINSIVSVISTVITMVIAFIAQTIFFKTLGEEYLGLNGLFSNIISILAVVELGIGPAIVYNLYRPVAENNKEKIKSLLGFYKKSYHIIALAIMALGICILPFLKIIVGDITINVNIYLVFLLVLIDTICSYLLTYKRSILIAHQKNYVIALVHLAYTVILNILQIGILIVFRNYIFYLLVKIIMRIVENIIITIIANKKYKYICEKDVKPLERDIIKDIFSKVKGLIFHKIGTFIVLGTDNILISTFIGVGSVGLYSNYLLVINGINSLFSQMFSSVTASVGNLLVENNNEKSFSVYKKIRFLNFWINTFCSSCMLALLQPFISMFFGKEALFGIGTVAIILLSWHLNFTRRDISLFKEAAGIYHEDRFIPIIESIINIVASIIFLKIFGLKGIFMGTITSSMVLFLYSYPKYVYKNLFSRKKLEYIKSFFMQLLQTIIIASSTYFLVNLINISNVYFDFVLSCIVSICVPNAILYIVYRKSEEYKYLTDILISLKNKFGGSNEK